MSKSIYLEVPEEMSEEDFLAKAQKEIILPHKAIDTLIDVLAQTGIAISKREVADWEVEDLKVSAGEPVSGENLTTINEE